MPDENVEYRSIEEVRSTFYPSSAAMVDLEKDEVLRFPTNLAKSKVQESAAKRREAEGQEETLE